LSVSLCVFVRFIPGLRTNANEGQTVRGQPLASTSLFNEHSSARVVGTFLYETTHSARSWATSKITDLQGQEYYRHLHQSVAWAYLSCAACSCTCRQADPRSPSSSYSFLMNAGGGPRPLGELISTASPMTAHPRNGCHLHLNRQCRLVANIRCRSVASIKSILDSGGGAAAWFSYVCRPSMAAMYMNHCEFLHCNSKKLHTDWRLLGRAQPELLTRTSSLVTYLYGRVVVSTLRFTARQ
jgi:hypothetical protein